MARDNRQWPQTISWASGASGSRNADGSLLLTSEQLQWLDFRHLLSELDHDHANRGDGCLTTFSGYTEWTSSSPAVISLGWDWLLEPGATVLRSIGAPRTNLVLCGPDGAAMPAAAGMLLLQRAIDQLPWQAAVLQHIGRRYRA